jgi:hypothetical protein
MAETENGVKLAGSELDRVLKGQPQPPSLPVVRAKKP